jgi:hypothetical protein
MWVIPVAVVRGVEAEQTKMPSEPTEMRIRSESRLAQRFRPYACDRPDFKRLEHRVHRDAVAIADTIGEIHGFAVDDEGSTSVCETPAASIMSRNTP